MTVEGILVQPVLAAAQPAPTALVGAPAPLIFGNLNQPFAPVPVLAVPEEPLADIVYAGPRVW